jgi:penicillin-binding protein 1A
MSTKENKQSKAVKKPQRQRSLIRRLIKWGVTLTILGVISGAALILWAIIHYGKDLPDHTQLANYEPKVITRVHAGDGSLLKEYSRQPRLFVPINVIPQEQINAFLAAEDKNFYEHFGLDMMGILRSVFVNIKNVATGNRNLVGASTITQQMARNFLLTLDQRFERKIKEMILTLRIEKAFTKDEILELYLNEINMGNRSYGIAAAALNYFDKSLGELSLGERAYLAALPKAPHNYHPIRNKDRAIARRNWVVGRMEILGFITPEEAKLGREEDLITVNRGEIQYFAADHFVEEIRRELYGVYGSTNLYEGGLSVRTTLEPKLQAIAEETLRNGLVAYDRRHGWRGAFGKIDVSEDWAQELGVINRPLGISSWRLALVLETNDAGAVVGFEDNSYGFIHLSDVSWARANWEKQKLGPKVKDISDVMAMGDVIAVDVAKSQKKQYFLQTFINDDGNQVGVVKNYSLQQVPKVEGALVAMDPHTGRVLAMVGGFDYKISEFNRATQAKRQPGSAFKPFVYAAALDAGFTPASLVLDAPFVMDQGEGKKKWKPKNYTTRFYGPSTLRVGIESSRNLMTVRLAQYLGMDRVVEYASKFGLNRGMEATLANSLGASEVTLLDLTTAYSSLVNGGYKVTPTFVDRIQNRRGKTIYLHDKRDCSSCQSTGWSEDGNNAFPDVPDNREQILDPRTAYQVTSMLEGVVQRGSGKLIRSVGVPLAGKTGTTNDWTDAWFMGFSPDLVVGVFVGFDRPQTLGFNESGTAVSVPIFKDFMSKVLVKNEATPFRVPPGIRLVRVNAKTGLPAGPNDRNVILEAFIPGTQPKGKRQILDGSGGIGQSKGKVKTGTGGIY